MIRVEERIELPAPADEVFRFVSDFRNLPQWDPGIPKSRLVGPEHEGAAPIGLGSRFEVVSHFLGQDIPMTYRVTSYELQERRAELTGEGPRVIAIDRISISDLGAHCRVHWQADFEMKGRLGFATPLMRPLFVRLANKAIAGLKAHYKR